MGCVYMVRVKQSKRHYMVNRQSFGERILMNAASLTGVIVALADYFSNNYPLRTIMFLIYFAAFPQAVIRSDHGFFFPCCMALAITKHIFGANKARWKSLKDFTARCTWNIYLVDGSVMRRLVSAFDTAKDMLSQCRRCTPNGFTAAFAKIPISFYLIWLLLTLLPSGLATTTAKAMFVLLDLAWLALELLAAIFASGYAFICGTKVSNSIASAQFGFTGWTTSEMFILFCLTWMNFHRGITDRAVDLYSFDLRGIVTSFVAKLLVGFNTAWWAVQYLAAMVTRNLHIPPIEKRYTGWSAVSV